jgi:hypothetical protein
MKNYIYISDSKIRAFYEQYKRNDRRLSLSSSALSFDILGFRASLNQKSTEPTRQDKLSALEEHILANEVAKGNWRHFAIDCFPVYLTDPLEEFLMIGRVGTEHLDAEGRVHRATILLSGNAKHVIGQNPKASQVQSGLSYFPYIASRIQEWANNDRLTKLAMLNGTGTVISRHYSDKPTFDPVLRNGEVCEILLDMERRSNGIPLRLETLALKMFDATDNKGNHFYIYSPLYVAQN